jgi:PIN domain nuclease of toxin-antitoxin system
MKCLLDTHVLLWWLHDSARLRPETRALFANSNNVLLWSACSTWELAIKSQLGKLHVDAPLAEFIARVIGEQDLQPLPVHHAHAARVAELPPIHRDPFDRMLIAQAAVERVPLLTGDATLLAYGIECLAA